jgi:two-component system response regulator WspF
MMIGLVNRSPAETAVIRRAIGMMPAHNLLWEASTMETAIRLCREHRPDVLLLDMSAPDMGAVDATRRIMEQSPCAILLMACDVGKLATQVFEAMGHGALDAVDMPSLNPRTRDTGVAPLLAKLEIIQRRLSVPTKAPTRESSEAATESMAKTLVVIGASAGGPAALRTVLEGLPSNFPAAVVIVQHMDERFSQGMVDWLSADSALPIRLCKEGDSPVAGVVLLAGTNDHLVFKGANRLGYSAEPIDSVYRPSVDAFFASVIRLWRRRVIGVILTGMGKDGSVGLKGLRSMGHHTIVQDRRSSAVYGMPKAAIECGAAVEILPLDQIANGLVKALPTQK